MEGQKISIRIDTVQRLKKHKLWRYRYEVISKKSKFYKNAAWITSKIPLRDGHDYYVRLNENIGNPQIVKLFRKIHTKKH